MTDRPIPSPPGAPSPAAALVLERWNSWVRVWLPHTGETVWVDLDQQDFEVMAPKSGAAAAGGPMP